MEMFNIQTNTKYNQRFSTSDKIEKAFLEKKILTYAYQDGRGIFLWMIWAQKSV